MIEYFNNLSDIEINKLFKFWEEINLLNNCVVHDFLTSNKLIQNYVIKYKILILVKYSELSDIENIKLLLSLKPNSNRYVLVSDLENSYKLYDLFKVVNFFSKNRISAYIDVVVKGFPPTRRGCMLKTLLNFSFDI